MIGKFLLGIITFILLCQSREIWKERPRNIILGTQKDLLPHEIRVFLASLRSTGCDARVLIFSADDNRPDLDDLAATFGAEILMYNATDFSQHGPMNLHRFRLFRMELESTLGNPYDQVCTFCASHTWLFAYLT